MDNRFVLETSARSGFPASVSTSFTKQHIEKLIDILWKKRWDKTLGMKFAILYLEKYGKEGNDFLTSKEIDVQEIKNKYEELKSLS